jgi:ligand-binding sensor domain-containing protein/signal transduction histidine kinase
MKRLLTTACFFLLYTVLQAQPPFYFKHLQVEQGLSNNKVTCITQDGKGFLWFGTIDGLNRYDGYTFKIFRKEAGDPHSLGHNFVQSLLADDGDNLWVGTQKGLYHFNPANLKFTLLPFTQGLVIRSIKMDKENVLWIVAGASVFRYNPKTEALHRFSSNNMDVTAACIMQNGTVWLSTTSGTIRKFNAATGQFTDFDVFRHLPQASINSRTIETIYDTRKGSLLIGTLSEGVKLFDTATATCKDIVTYNADRTKIYAKDFLQVNEEEYWAATENGMIRYNINTNQYATLHTEYDNPYSLSDNAIYCVFKDREGGIWAGSRFGGVNYHAFPYTFFTKYFARPSVNSIEGNGVHEICPDQNGHLWIGTEDAGLNRLYPKTGLFEHFHPDGKKGSLSFNNIHGLLAEGNTLWIGTYQFGLDRMNIRTGKVEKHYTIGRYAFNTNFIVHLYRTKAGDLYAGTWEGLYRYNRKTDEFSPVPKFSFQTQSMLETEEGKLWICTLGNGVYLLDQHTGKIQNFRNDPHNRNSLCNNMVNGQFCDSKNNLWFTTDDGLSKYDPHTGRFKTYNTTNGFPGNFLFKMLEDKKGNLWISSTKGLICFNPETEAVNTFTTANGLLNDQFNWNSAYKDSTGRMYFGSVKGLISFVPEEFRPNYTIPPVYLTGFQVNNKEVLIGDEDSPLKNSITYTAKVTLPYDQSTFSLDFAALSYASPKGNRYAYKLEGFDKDWTFLRHNRKVYFTGLPPGTYTFKVKASNASGTWNEKQTMLQIEILPPLWASRWAFLLYALFGLLAASVVVRIYKKQFTETNKRRMEQREHEKEKELYQNKLQFFTNVAHEIRTPLTLILGPMENVMNHVDAVPEMKNNLKIMERNTNHLVALTDQLLDFRLVETKGFSLKFETINLIELLQNTHANFEPLAVQQQLQYRLSSAVQTFWARVDPDSMQKILNNLYSNAIKYAASRVQVLFKTVADEGKIRIEIRNDGPLIPPEEKEAIFQAFYRLPEAGNQKGSGIGLTIARTLAELHGGTLALNEPINKMNVFVLELPVTKEQTSEAVRNEMTKHNQLF